MLSLKNNDRKVYRTKIIPINMVKKEIGLQFTCLVLGITLFTWLLSWKGNNKYPVITSFIFSVKPIFLSLIIVLFVPIITNLLLQTFSRKKDYNEKPYYKILNSCVHICLSVLILLALIFIFAYLYVTLDLLFRTKFLALIISSIIILVLILVIDALCEKYFKVKLFGWFTYISNVSKY